MGFKDALHSSNSEQPMSQMGQSRPFRAIRWMSELPSTTDIERTCRQVREVPGPDICVVIMYPDRRRETVWLSED